MATKLPKLLQAVKLILQERDNLAQSASRAVLFRLETIAAELERIEDSL